MSAISWKTGQSDDWTDPAAWSTGSVPGSGDDVAIGVAPSFGGLPYTIMLRASQAVQSITQSQPASTLAMSNSTLTVSGGYALAGTLLLDQATLQAASVASAGGQVLLASASTIEGAAWHGTLDVALSAPNPYYYTSLNLVDDSFTNADGSGAGSIVLNAGVQAVLEGGTALSRAAVTLNDAGLAQSSGTLLIGSLSTITATGRCVLASDNAALQNDGAISASGTTTSLSITATSFFGQGSVSVSNGASLFLSGGSVADTGVFSVGAGSYMDIHSNDAAGLLRSQFRVQGGTLSLNASLATAQLAELSIAAGTLAISGSLQNTASTLNVGAGSNLANVELAGGTITGGTIASHGAFSVGDGAPQSPTSQDGVSALTGVTVQGALAVSGHAQLNVQGLTLTGAGGSEAGSLAIGGGATVSVLDNETLNATVSLGVAGEPSSYPAGGLYAAGTLTLGAQNSVDVFSAGVSIAGSNQSGLVINRGSITLGTAPASLSLYDVVNAGQIRLSGGGQLQLSTVTNTGTIACTGGTITVQGATVNAGLLSLSGTASLLTSYGYTAGLTNSGTLSLSGGAAANLGNYGTGWTNSGLFVIDHARLTLGGIFTTAQLGRVQASLGGTIGVSSGTLVNTGTLSIGQGAGIAALDVAGVIQGGIIDDAGGGLLGDGGILSGVAYRGVLSLTQADLYIGGGTSFSGRSGGAGSISVSGAGAALLSYGNETLDQVAVSLGSAASAGATLGASQGTTLTLGSGAVVTQTGAFAQLGAAQYGAGQGVVVNQGQVNAAIAGGTLCLAGALANAGTIAVSNGETLVLSLQSLANTGSISVTDATADVQNATAAQLSALHLVHAALIDTGTLSLTGSTLSVGPGGLAPLLQVAGRVQGGTIHDAGGGVQFAGSATLDGVTYQGTMAINRPLSTVTVVDGLTLHGVSGSFTGSLALTGAGCTLVWDATQALDGALFSIGSNAVSYGGHVLAAPSLIGPAGGAPVQLGSHLHIQQAGLYADIGGGYDTVSSAATLSANTAHGQFVLQGSSFTNTGTIGVSATDTLLVDAAGFTNAGLMVVTTGSAVDLDLYSYFAQGSLAAQSFTNTGTMMMAGGMVMELTDNGAFPNVALLNAAGGRIAGAGVVASRVDNTGVVEARGGVLNLVQAVSGTGTLQVDGGAMLVLGGVGSGQTVNFAGAGGVLGLQPAYFLGTIGGFAPSDTIDLFNTSARSAAFSGSSIVVQLSNGGTLRLATTSALGGSLSLTAGTHGDELVRFAANAALPALSHDGAADRPSYGARHESPAPSIGHAMGFAHVTHVS